MAKVSVKGVFRVRSKGKIYWYAWRGGPRLEGEPGTEEWTASLVAAREKRHRPKEDGTFRSLVTLYRGSPAYHKLAYSTQDNWSPWLDRIAAYFGILRLTHFEQYERIRPAILRWHQEIAQETPRSADYGLQVLSRVLSFAVANGKLSLNACAGIEHAYHSDRSMVIWTADDITQLKLYASAEIAVAVDFAALTGLRLGDLMRVSWSHVQDDAIAITTGKSRYRREAVIPLYDELKTFLDQMPRVATTVLVNSWQRPWTADGFGSSFNKAKRAAQLERLHFHDLRGTAATNFYTAGLDERVIAEIMGWSEQQVRRILRRYVTRNAAVYDTILRLRNKRLADTSPNVIALPERMARSGVYFAVSGERVKIGWSGAVRLRLRELQIGNPGQIRIVHVIDGDRTDESRLHSLYDDYRIRGEWFRLEGTLADFLAPFIAVAENEARS